MAEKESATSSMINRRRANQLSDAVGIAGHPLPAVPSAILGHRMNDSRRSDRVLRHRLCLYGTCMHVSRG